MPKTSPLRQTKAIRPPVKPTSAKTKRLTKVEIAQNLLLPILRPYVSGEPSTFIEAVRRLYDENLNQYYQLNKFLGPLFFDNERHHLKVFDRHKARLAEKVVRLASYGLPPDGDKQHPPTLPTIPEALELLDAGYPEPFFRLLPLFGPLLFEKKEVQQAISSWFRLKDSEKQSTRDRAQEFLTRIGTALAYLKKGRISPQQDDARRVKKEEKARFRKEDLNTRIRQEKQSLETQILARIEKIPRAVARTTGPAYRHAREKIIAEVLNDAVLSSNRNKREAAKKLRIKYNLKQNR